jgi:pyruvate/2-oxoglutarate dehydrogenase complex dihydrolipoamide acyltransferase (E2) component
MAMGVPQFVYSDEFQDIRMTYMPFFIKAAFKALENFPILNVKVDELG